jgi:MoxR-like ATPase
MATSAAQKQITLNIDELKEFLTHIVVNNRTLQDDGMSSVAVEIEGESGIGKTSSALQLADEMKMNVVKLNLAQIEELGDLVGFPVRQFQLCKTEGNGLGTTSQMVKKIIQVPEIRLVTKQVEELVEETKVIPKQVMVGGKLEMRNVSMPVKVKKFVDKQVEETIMVDKTVEEPQTVWAVGEVKAGECMWIDEQAVQEYLKQGFKFTGMKRMSYCPPEWIADKQGGGFLILDDWNRADIRFIQAVMELIDRGEYISWKLPKDWHIILTANPDNGEYLVQSIDIAQKTRYIRTKLVFNADVWGRWAEAQKIDSRCINFLLLNPELVTVEINPRSITTFFNAIRSIPDFSKALPLIQMIGEGSVGPEFTTTFAMFINNKLDKLVSPKEMLMNPNEAFILGELRSCIGRGPDYRADIASVLTTRLINWTINYSEKGTISQKEIDRLITYATDPDTLTDDLKYILVKKILNGNKQKFQKMMLNQKVIEMSMK